MAETFRARGEGGAIFTFDTPDEASPAAERLAALLASGALTLVDDDGRDIDPEPAEPEPVKAPPSAARKPPAK